MSAPAPPAPGGGLNAPTWTSQTVWPISARAGGGEIMTDEQKATIDAMTQEDMARRWRFARAGDPLLQGDVGEYFAERFNRLGGFTPEISKKIGW